MRKGISRLLALALALIIAMCGGALGEGLIPHRDIMKGR
jgi:hypothetical protein